MSQRPRRGEGERLGPFEVVRYLASGGMGDVYVARAVASGDLVALKLLGDTSAASLERFEREGRIAATLEHPNIVAGRAHGRLVDGTAYIAMELLEGRDLDTQLETDGVSPTEIVAISIQVCDALAAAHARRIVHRDLKPQNIYLCSGTPLRAKVLDFGVARLADDRRVTGTGTLLGTWGYMSPEQARAEPDVDARSDLWSLGVVLYECLAGRPPFEAPTGAGTLYQILFERPPDLARVRPELPTTLVELVHKALSKPRDERFGSAQAMRAALAALDVEALTERRRVIAPASSPSGTDATLDGTGLDATMLASASETVVENRLTSVVFLRGVKEPALVHDVARELQGRVITLAGDGVLVTFGTERWTGDEPLRAVRLALAVAASARTAGVATGRALRGASHVAGAAVDAAVALARGEGVQIDATTAGVVRAAYRLVDNPDGSARLDPRAQPTSRAAAEAPSGTPFVGRDSELAFVVDPLELLHDSPQPVGAVVLASVGMGKSRLRHEALAEVARRWPDATCLSARCEAFRRDSPFAAIIDALGDVVDASVTGIFAAVAKGGGDPVAALDRARTSLETVLRGLAERGPIVLAIDDAQWLDASSQAALRWVFENASDLPLAVWLFGRPEARAVAASVLPGASTLELKPLARAASEKLLAAIVGHAPDALLERAGGQPLFLEELGRLYATRGVASIASGASLPPSVEGAHLAQIDQLDPNDREFLKRASVLGRVGWVEAVVSLGAEPSGFDALRKANLVVPRPRPRFENTREFSFRSGVLHEVAYGLWTDAQRIRLHERAAEWLASQRGVPPDEMARHWELAGDATRAAEAYTAAAEASAYVSDMSTTCAHAERALSLSKEPAIRWRALVARDDALQLAGDRAVQRTGIAELLALAESMDDRHRAEAAWRECYFARMTSERERTVAAGERAIALARAAHESRWEATACIELAMQCADEGQIQRAVGFAARARDVAAEREDEWLLARATGTEAYVRTLAGEHGTALELNELAARRYARAGDRRREALALANLGMTLAMLGRLAEAVERIGAAIEASRRVGNARTIAVCTHNLGQVHREQGNLVAAEDAQSRAVEQLAKLHHPRLAASIATERVYLALLSGATRATLIERVQMALASAIASRIPDVLADAYAAALRAQARAVTEPLVDIAEARGHLEQLAALHESRADLASALWEATGRLDDDRRTARAALEDAVRSVRDGDERTAVRASIVRRRLLPAEFAT